MRTSYPSLRQALALALFACLCTAQAAPRAAIQQAAQAEQAPLLDTLRDLVNIESGSKDTEGLAKIAELIAGRLRALGGTVELLKPTDDRNQFLVYTRWRSEEDFQAWMSSAAFGQGHKAHNNEGPVSTQSELWSFEVTQHERAGSGS